MTFAFILPVEILHEVFIQLPLFQRLECMFVCRSWYHVLGTRSLLHDISIRDEERFHKFNEMIERFPFRANQVEELELYCCIYRRYDRRAIPNIFPNLRRIELNDISEDRNLSVYRKPLKANSTKSKIEHITDHGDCNLIIHLIASDLCATIKTLEINLPKESTQKNEVISRLKNMPALNILTMSGGSLTIKDCETLHGNLPTITTFRLSGVNLIDEFDELDFRNENVSLERVSLESIKPANTITKIDWNFQVLFDDFIESYTQWCQYMTHKYTNLSKIHLFNSELDDEEPEFVLELFRDYLLPFLQVNAKHLKILNINRLPSGLNFFEELDRFDCRIEEFEYNPIYTTPMPEDLGKSNQTNYIQILSLSSTTLNDVSMFEHFKVLTSLSLTASYVLDEDKQSKINMNDLVASLPNTLKNLSISEYILEFDQAANHSTLVEELYLSCNIITENVVNTISSCFPKLKKLSLYGYVAKSVKLSLPNHHLSFFSISEYGSQQSYHISVISDKHHKPRYYAIQANSSGKMNSKVLAKKPVSMSQKKIDSKPIFSLECASINQVYFSNYLVDLSQ